MRFLQSTVRRLDSQDNEAYYAAWKGVQVRAEHIGARAWLFRESGEDDVFIEFIEWKQNEGDARLPLEISESLRTLARFGPGEGRTWMEP